MIRVNKIMSQAELAYKTGYSIQDIISFETNGTIIKGFVLLQILNAFEITIDEFRNL
ncbi:helix-turn-helix domain-containing protein [Anaerocolumna sp.]|uniref:helix-turn-helix domain-containing protein n=1 Tax=Anaerocolumna sp. TaxID=2041569 RepID=UPI0028AC4B8E|nr:helix-turn-helix transcriptional regulator [Anaerocolumna sp.]